MPPPAEGTHDAAAPRKPGRNGSWRERAEGRAYVNVEGTVALLCCEPPHRQTDRAKRSGLERPSSSQICPATVQTCRDTLSAHNRGEAQQICQCLKMDWSAPETNQFTFCKRALRCPWHVPQFTQGAY